MFWNTKKKAAEKAAAIAREEHLDQVREGMIELMQTQTALTPEQQGELKKLAAAAGIVGSALRIAQVIKKADELGDALHNQTMKMIEDAGEMTPEAKRCGRIDPQKLAEASERLQKLIEKENEEREERLKKLEEHAKKLRETADELMNTAAKIDADNKKKALAVAQEKQREADWRGQGCPVTTDVTVGKPLKLKPRMT